MIKIGKSLVVEHTGNLLKERREAGITLVALVITIIILLILAGITIVQLKQNWLFEESKVAKERTGYTSAKEIIQLKLMEVQTDCMYRNVDYNIKEIAINIKNDEQITIEKYYNKDSQGTTENLIELKGIVVSVNQYSKYKFLIGESCEIEGVTTEQITDTFDKENFTPIEEFEKEIFKKTEESKPKEEIIEIPRIGEGVDTSKTIEIETYIAIKSNTVNTLTLDGIENAKYQLEDRTDNVSLKDGKIIANKNADSKDSCKITITGMYEGQDYINHLIALVEPKNKTTVTDEEENIHDAYAIYTSDDLVRFAELINHKVQSIENVAIMNEINLEGIEWISIGDSFVTGEDFMYKGIFDGKGNTIKNITISKATRNGDGTFIRFIDNGIIKNLNIDNIYIYSEDNTVGFISQAYNGTIIDNVKILSGEITTTKGYASGIGSLYDDSKEKGGIIRNCYNNATISAKEDYVGGICSFQKCSNIENCQNDGKIIGRAYVGGICGNSRNSTIKNCQNNATIIGTSKTGDICGKEE